MFECKDRSQRQPNSEQIAEPAAPTAGARFGSRRNWISVGVGEPYLSYTLGMLPPSQWKSKLDKDPDPKHVYNTPGVFLWGGVGKDISQKHGFLLTEWVSGRHLEDISHFTTRKSELFTDPKNAIR